MASLHTRKGLAKITAHPHCTNLAGGGGFTGGKSNMRCHLRKRFGKHKSCSFCLTRIPNTFLFRASAIAVKGNCSEHRVPCGASGGFRLPKTISPP